MRLFLIILFSLPLMATNTVYVAQSSAGANDGTSCANAKAITYFNSAGNWSGSPTGIQIGPDTTVHLCGAITSQMTVNGSGTSGHVITVKWESGARVSATFGQIISLGAFGYLLFDGGFACGPGTACDTVEAAHLTGYAAGQTGIIEATDNGSALGHQDASTDSFYGCNACNDIEIKNLIIRNLYQHTDPTDVTDSADTGTFIFQAAYGVGGALGVISVHDSTVHDTGNAISLQRGNSTTFNVYNIDFYRNNWAMEYSGAGTRTLNFYNNYCHDTSNWDTNSDKFHHNCLHSYLEVSANSIATNFYNNLSFGDWGNCCTTTTGIFTEFGSPNNFNAFNNVAIQYPGNTAEAWEYAAITGVFANNTAIGVATTPSNVEAIYVDGSNITFENNTVEGYGQYLVVNPGTTFTSLDYNQWGAIGLSGNDPWAWGGSGVATFAAWKSACSCDSHSGNPAHIGVNANGVPQAGSALIGAGFNLTSLSISALDSDVLGVARPGSGAWDVGAYQFGASGTAAMTTTGKVVMTGKVVLP